MTDTPMTADDWEPSEEMKEVFNRAYEGSYSPPARDPLATAIKAVRPLIIAEEKPKIEAEERERIVKRLEDWDETEAAGWVRALGGKP